MCVCVCAMCMFVCVCGCMFFCFPPKKNTRLFFFTFSFTLSYSLSLSGNFFSSIKCFHPCLCNSFSHFLCSFFPSFLLLSSIDSSTKNQKKKKCFRHNHSSLSLLWRGLGQRDKGTKGDQGEGRKEGKEKYTSLGLSGQEQRGPHQRPNFPPQANNAKCLCCFSLPFFPFSFFHDEQRRKRLIPCLSTTISNPDLTFPIWVFKGHRFFSKPFLSFFFFLPPSFSSSAPPHKHTHTLSLSFSPLTSHFKQASQPASKTLTFKIPQAPLPLKIYQYPSKAIPVSSLHRPSPTSVSFSPEFRLKRPNSILQTPSFLRPSTSQAKPRFLHKEAKKVKKPNYALIDIGSQKFQR